MNNVIIIGGGIAGLCAAISLQKIGLNVKVYDKNIEPTVAGAGIIIAPNAMQALEPYGISEQIRTFGNESDGFNLVSEKGSILSKLTIPTCYPKIYSIHRKDLHQLLLSELQKGTVEWGKECVKIDQNEENALKILFQDGSEALGNILIAADGIHSVVRKQVTQSDGYRYAGYTCWRGVTPAHNLSLTNDFIETWGTNGRFGIVPLPNNEVYWYALINAKARDRKYTAYTTADLYNHFKSYHSPIPDILNNASDVTMIHRDIVDITPMKQFFDKRIVFIGDAAHALTPNLGQGACQAIEDAIILAECIKKNAHYRQAFIEYEQKRRARIEIISNTAWKVGKMAQIESKPLTILRNHVMKRIPKWVSEKQAHELYSFHL
ncbi:FAD-dependent monooxygenase [Bacillus toyonensis]|uniref:FAD-binding protein n=1 Tax=Bacillus toyonensis TaxID=155322 RepID=A0A2C4R512_9BACI|nr:FAD-dependent monooxygenase [Bacillus toyonensis]PGB01233.1 FAD-binding protein [Bacillus toyonensis]PHD71772.1 FAD-binding protein [Bacillus toyonensis]